MYETKSNIDKIYGKLTFDNKEDIIKELLQGKTLPYVIAPASLITPTFAHVQNIFDALNLS
jgi:hypothetical protein